MEQRIGSKSRKEYVKAVYFHLVCLNFMRGKCQARWVTSWSQDFQEKYQQSRYADDTTLMAESE